MLEEAYSKTAMKKVQVYVWHEGGNVSVNNDLCCGQS
jgi:hypothetical protein